MGEGLGGRRRGLSGPALRTKERRADGGGAVMQHFPVTPRGADLLVRVPAWKPGAPYSRMKGIMSW